MPAPELPNVNASGTTNAVLSNHMSSVGLASTPEPMRLGRWPLTPMLATSREIVGVHGSLLLMRALGPHVVHFQRVAPGELLLNADVPPLVGAHLGLEGKGSPAHAADRGAERDAQKEVRQRARGHHVGGGRHGFAQTEGQ